MELDLDEEEEEDYEDAFEMDALLEALPAVDGVSNLGVIAEALTETERINILPSDQRDPWERYMEQPDRR